MSSIDSKRYKALSALQEWQDNYNRGDVEAIARSIRRFGMNAALRVWRNDTVMAGNHTLKALRLIREQGPDAALDRDFPPANVLKSGDEWFVQYVDVSHLDALEAKAYAIADNALARRAVTDDKLLAHYLQEIVSADRAAFEATGYDSKGLEKLLLSIGERTTSEADADVPLDRAAELRAKWQVEPDQLWLIESKTTSGMHRLLCGDCTDPADVTRLMEGQRAVLFATDPPYLVGYDGKNHPHKWGEPDKNKDWSESYHDWDDPEQGEALYDAFVGVARGAALVDEAAWYCWHASRGQAMLEDVWKRHGAFVHQQIIWAKDRPVLTRSWYMWQHEPCFFGWVQGKKPKRVADDYPPSVWMIPTIAPGQQTEHPTSKPLELFAIPMRQHTVPGEVCYEPFAGSGSQFVAGEQLGRLVYGIEIQPEYCAVILERLSKMGLEPRLA